MIQELLRLKRITHEQAEIFILYHLNEVGKNSLQKRMTQYFMEEPQDMNFTGVGFAFYDGRRSVFRDIYRTIKFVESKIKELEKEGDNVGRESAAEE